jgi:hypothetical protein
MSFFRHLDAIRGCDVRNETVERRLVEEGFR